MENNYISTQIEYSAIQMILLLNLEKKIPEDDVLHTFLRVMEGVNLKITQHFRCHSCTNCKNKKECTKSDIGRTIQKNYVLDELRDNAKELLDSKKGIEYSKNRSIYSEGVFGILKQEYEYIRLHRRGKLKTELELTLVIIGFNINKLHNKLNRPKVRN